MKKTAAVAEAVPTFEAAIIVYGQDDGGKAHASVFGPDDAELALKAAGAMRMVALPVATDECRALALGLPKGRIFSSGRGFVPFCKTATFEALQALGGSVPPVPDAPPLTLPFASLATSFDAIDVGQLVLAPETLPTVGWYEAVVIEVKAEDLYVLRWYSWPDLPPIVRRRDDLALLRRAPEGDEPKAE